MPDDLGVTNGKVTNKVIVDARPVLSMGAAREGAPAASGIHGFSRVRSGVLLIEKF
jgi:hypothetical protein